MIVELDCLLPARHRGHQLPPRARQELGRGARRSTPSAGVLRYFHGPGLFECSRRGLRGLFRIGRSPAGERAAALHRARALRRRPGARPATSCAPPRASCSRTIWPGARRQPVRALRASSSGDVLPRAAGRRPASDTTPTRSPPCGWPARRSSWRRPRASGCSAARRAGQRAPWPRSSTAARRCRSAWRGARRSIRRELLGAPGAAHGTRAMSGLDEASRERRRPGAPPGVARSRDRHPAPAVRRLGGGRRRPPMRRGHRRSHGAGLDARRGPGTAAGALRDAGLWRPGTIATSTPRSGGFAPASRPSPPRRRAVVLGLDGMATWPRSFSTASCVLTSESMFSAPELDVSRLLRERRERAQLALSGAGAAARGAAALTARPVAHRLVAERNLRFFARCRWGARPGSRRSGGGRPLPAGLARAPPGCPRGLQRLVLRSRLDRGAGYGVSLSARGLAPPASRSAAASLALRGPASAVHGAGGRARRRRDSRLRRGRLQDPARFGGRIRMASPALYEVSVRVQTRPASQLIDPGRVGFRDAARAARARRAEEGLDWTSTVSGVRPRRGLDAARSGRDAALARASCARAWKRSARAGMNMVRDPGHRRL